MNGIDVSHHQEPGLLDYEKLKEEGYEWVIARACYGVRNDEKFLEHVKKARAAGLKVGGYIFFRQQQGAAEQLEVFQSQLEAAGIGVGDIAPVVDLEWNTEYDGPVNPGWFDEKAQSIMQSLREEYGECIAYLAPYFYETLKKPSWVLDFPWWVAHYTTAGEPSCPFKEDWSMHQYSAKGKLSAYPSGELDLNFNSPGNLPLVQLPAKPLPVTPPGPIDGDGSAVELIDEIKASYALISEGLELQKKGTDKLRDL